MNTEKFHPHSTEQETILSHCFCIAEKVRNKMNIILLQMQWHVIGKWVIIEQWVVLKWRVYIGDGTKILWGARIEDATIGKNCEIRWEVKRSILWDNVKAKHPCVISNADIGDYSNIAAGVVFGNYNGIEKGYFVLWERVFVGANSTLVLKSETEKRIIGNWAYIPSNTAIECNIPELGRFIPFDRYKDQKIDDLLVPGWYIRQQSGINTVRKTKKHT